MVRCGCGRELEVPTMRTLTHLPKAQSAEEVKPLWTSWHGVAFLGVVTMITALVFTGYLYAHKPVFETAPLAREEDIRKRIESMTLSETWRLWLFWQNGLQDGDAAATQVAYQKALASIHRQMIAGLAVAGGGLLVAGGGLIMLRRQRT